MAEAFALLREAGLTHVLIFGTQVSKKGTEVVWNFSGADGGDAIALLGMLRYLEDEVPFLLDAEITENSTESGD